MEPPTISAMPRSGRSARQRNVPILLQKSARRSQRAKTGNNRIETNKFLNQNCAVARDFESILLAWVLKIFLQQYLPSADISRHQQTSADISRHQRDICQDAIKRRGVQLRQTKTKFLVLTWALARR